MNELLQTLLYAVITTVVPILGVYLSTYLKAKRNVALQNIENDYIQNALMEATDIIFTVVDATSQVYVDNLKKAGEFTLEKQQEALESAIDTAKTLIEDETAGLIIDKYNDLDEWIRLKIEAYISQTK